MDFSKRIRLIRKQMGLSQFEFGELVNLSQRTVAAWELGDRTPSFATLADLAAKLNVSLDYLLGRTDEKQNEKKQPAADNSELLDDIIARLRSLPAPALSRVSIFLEGLQAGQEIAKEAQANPDPADTSAG